jgi:hypothetical protein
MGASTWTVLTRYLFLNVIQSVPVLFTLNAADAILILGGLGLPGARSAGAGTGMGGRYSSGAGCPAHRYLVACSVPGV